MKLLSIGNSFSTDAHFYLHRLAELNGVDLYTANLFIGGCSLQTHWQNVTEDNADYDYEINGNTAERKISIAEALTECEWDVITFQQASAYSGMPDTFEPYLTNLVSFVRQKQPQAKLYFHQTWSYENGSPHSGFVGYDSDSRKMFESIVSASDNAIEITGATLIPAGTVIQKLRDGVKEFDYTDGGLSLCRDTYHLSETYGRYAAAAIWLRTLTGKAVATNPIDELDINLIEKINTVVNSI